MTTPSTHLSHLNHQRSITEFFADNFSAPIAGTLVSYANRGDQDPAGGTHPVVVRVSFSASDVGMGGFGLVTFRTRSRINDDKFRNKLMKTVDAVKDAMRISGGKIPLLDFSNVDDAADDPVGLGVNILVLNSRGYRGEANTVTAPVQTGEWQHVDVIYRFQFAQDIVGVDNI